MKKNKKTHTGKGLNGQSGKTNSPPRYLFLGLGILGLGVASYIGYRYWKARQQNNEVTSPHKLTIKKVRVETPTIKHTWKDDSFPLTYNPTTGVGSSGPRVVQLQQKLNQKYGAGLVTDGKFGPLTKKALFANNYRGSVDSDTFNNIVDEEPTIVFDPKKIAAQLWRTSNAGNLNAVLGQLRLIKDVSDYQSVSTPFKTFRDPSDFLRSHTIVTHLLDFAFKDNDTAKEQLKKEFIRMGLVERSGKWSLSGLGNPAKLITLKNTYVRDLAGNIVEVKKNTILGLEQYSTQGLTWFKAIDGSMAAVPSTDVKYSR
jgi:hypothetical protein